MTDYAAIFDPRAIGEITTFVAGPTLGVLQALKQNSRWKNRWCLSRGWTVGIAWAVGGMVASGNTDALALFHAISGGVVAWLTATVGYNAQKPLGWIQPGPNNHPEDIATPNAGN